MERNFETIFIIWYSFECTTSIYGDVTMARVCEICGKKPQAGQNTQHRRSGGWYNRAPRTKTRFIPNLQEKKILYQGKVQKLKVCTRCLRTLDKKTV